MSDELATVEKELAEYVGLRQRLGGEDFRFADALIAHRRQAFSNLRDSEDMFWSDRVKLLDRVAAAKNVPLADEEQLRYVLDEIAERERRRRAEELGRRREAS